MTRPRAAPALEPTEAQFQAQVIELARLLGWRCAHFRPALTRHGWRTPVQADGAGFPDLVLVRDRVVFAELKTRRTKPNPDQQEWLDALHDAGADTHLWRPADLDEIAAALARHPAGHTPSANQDRSR